MDPSSVNPSPEDQRVPSGESPPPATVDTENPFIAFRRFADSQISSLLQSVIGLPSLLSHPESGNRWPSVDDFAAKRRDAMVRAHQELVDQLERDIQESLVEKDDVVERQQREMEKWGGFLDAAKVNHPRQQRDPTGQRLSGHEKLGWDGKQRTEAKTIHSTKKTDDSDERFSVSSADGRIPLNRIVDRRDEGQGFWMAKDDPRLEFNTVTGQDPLSDAGQAISWLLTDDYSPLYLDRTLPHKLHPSFYKCDEHDSYFRGDYNPGDLYPRFASTSVVRHDPRISERVDWRAAFHDLLSLHHQGCMPQRSQFKAVNEIFRIDAGAWIGHLVLTGSLGPRWHQLDRSNPIYGPYCFRYGSMTEAWAVPRFTGQFFVRDSTGRSPLAPFGMYEQKNDSLPLISASRGYNNGVVGSRKSSEHQQNLPSRKEPEEPSTCAPEAHDQSKILEATDDDWFSNRPAFTEAAISLIRNPDTEQSMLRIVDRVLRLIENPDFEDEAEGILKEVFDGVDLKASNVSKKAFANLDQLLRSDYFKEWKEAKDAVDSEHPAVYGVTLPEPVQDDLSPGQKLASLSSSSSSYRHRSGDESSDSILSTLTTVESRTLPDGRIQTKRILKKRFADGREENSESVETQAGRSDRPTAERAMSEKVEGKAPGGHQQPTVPTESKKQVGGWFWN